MPDAPLATGKLPAKLLDDLLSSVKLPPEVLLGPRLGEDACAIRIGSGALVVATDPITLIGSGVGAHSVVINANDVAVMGCRPRWFLAAVMLPEGTRASEVRALFTSMQEALADLGAVLVGGHTEVTPAVRQPVVVGQMLGLREDGDFVRTGGARAGDVVVQVGEAPVEGAAVLAAEAADRLIAVDRGLIARARRALEDPGISVVEAALAAADLGAVALHDPTEGGLSAGLWELASASGVALEIDEERVRWFEPGRALCDALGADPWGLLASGALLAAFRPEGVQEAMLALSRRGFEPVAIGRAAEGEGVWLASGALLPRYDRDEVARVLAERT